MAWLRITNTSTPARPVSVIEAEPNIPVDPGTSKDDWVLDRDAATFITDAWALAPAMNSEEEDAPLRTWEWLEPADAIITALAMDGEITLDHWYQAEAGFWLSSAPFDLEIEVLKR
jgi:hypothetical protein